MTDDLATLVQVLRDGGVVACPTETWLGLLADAHDEAAVERVAELKGRPPTMPIALLLPNVEAIEELALPPCDRAKALMEVHWPGPLTVLLLAKPGLSPRLTLEGKIGVRLPGPSPAAELVKAFGHPLTATSANRTGEPPLRSADELPAEMASGLAARVSGVSPGGAPSTLLDSTTSPMRVLRQGAVVIDEASL